MFLQKKNYFLQNKKVICIYPKEKLFTWMKKNLLSTAATENKVKNQPSTFRDSHIYLKTDYTPHKTL